MYNEAYRRDFVERANDAIRALIKDAGEDFKGKEVWACVFVPADWEAQIDFSNMDGIDLDNVRVVALDKNPLADNIKRDMGDIDDPAAMFPPSAVLYRVSGTVR